MNQTMVLTRSLDAVTPGHHLLTMRWMLTLSVHFLLPVLPHVLMGPSTIAQDGGLRLSPTVLFVLLLGMTETLLLPAHYQPIRLLIQLDYLLSMTALQGRPLPSVIQILDLYPLPNLRMRLVRWQEIEEFVDLRLLLMIEVFDLQSLLKTV